MHPVLNMHMKLSGGCHHATLTFFLHIYINLSMNGTFLKILGLYITLRQNIISMPTVIQVDY